MTRTWDGLTSEVQRDYPHEIGIAIYLNESGRGWSYAAILPHSGTVIAWDGRYFEQHNMPAAKHRGALVDLAEQNDRPVAYYPTRANNTNANDE